MVFFTFKNTYDFVHSQWLFVFLTECLFSSLHVRFPHCMFVFFTACSFSSLRVRFLHCCSFSSLLVCFLHCMFFFFTACSFSSPVTKTGVSTFLLADTYLAQEFVTTVEKMKRRFCIYFINLVYPFCLTFQIESIPSEKADIFVQYIQKHIPAGVSVDIELVSACMPTWHYIFI